MSNPSEHRELRDAYGCFATGITVVTAFDPEGRAVGVTANSFSSLSLDPPLILWCIGRQSATFDAFSVTDRFTVTVLGEDGIATARRFAMKGEHFVGDEGLATALGPPALPHAIAVFECATHARFEGGDHVILVGRVVRFAQAEGNRKPLVYSRGRYCTVTGEAAG